MPGITLSIDESDLFETLGDFLTSILPASCPVQKGQENRTAEPVSSDYALMWSLSRPRLETNVDSYLDAVFTGSISAAEMTITAANPRFTGQLAVGSTIFGAGVASGTVVTALGTGTGGVGTYTLNNVQTLGPITLAAGVKDVLQPTEVVVQVDVHGPASADNVQIISTLFRDEFATLAFAESGFDVTPLYAEDPRQVPFVNDQKQYEERWTVDLHLQANPVLSVPQEFADLITVTPVSVDATYVP